MRSRYELHGGDDSRDHRERRRADHEVEPGHLHLRQSHLPILREQKRSPAVYPVRDGPPECHALPRPRGTHIPKTRPRAEPHAGGYEASPEGVLPDPLHEPGSPRPRIGLHPVQILSRLDPVQHVRLRRRQRRHHRRRRKISWRRHFRSRTRLGDRHERLEINRRVHDHIGIRQGMRSRLQNHQKIHHRRGNVQASRRAVQLLADREDGPGGSGFQNHELAERGEDLDLHAIRRREDPVRPRVRVLRFDPRVLLHAHF